MKRFSGAFTQGGQTELHHLHMIQQVVSSTLKIAFFLSSLFFTTVICYKVGLERLYFVLVYYKTSIRMDLQFLPKGFFDSSWVFFNGQWAEVNDYVIANYPGYVELATFVKAEIFKGLLQSILFFCFILVVLSAYWIARGKKKQTMKILKGYELVSPKKLKTLVMKHGASSINIANIPLPKNSECEHIMITGTTGSGKTNAIHSILKQIRLLRHKVIIVDTSGGFASRFYDEKRDKLLNPFDKRSSHWNLWSECIEEYDFDEFAESLIPLDSHDKFWTRAAQQLFSTSALLMKRNEKESLEELLDTLLSKPLKETVEHFEGTFVSAYVDPATEKTALGIRATLISALRSLKFLEDESENNFSIRQWLTNDQENGWLFLSSLPTQRETLKPLMSAWLSIAIKSLMSMGEDFNRRIWFVVDELASLNRVPILMQGLAEVRRYGGCMVLGFQDMQQLDVIYGSKTARTIAGLAGTKIVFRLDDNAAREAAALFGEQEIQEANESISFGAHQMREGVSLTDHKQIRSLISPVDLMKLDNFEAYLKFPRNLPTTKIRFNIQSLG